MKNRRIKLLLSSSLFIVHYKWVWLMGLTV